MKRLLLLLTLCFCLSSQSTKVIPLEASDTAMAKQAYDALEAAKKRWQQVDDFVQNKYGAGQGKLEYSDDFRYMVKPLATNGCSGNICWGTLSPVDGTVPLIYAH